VATLTLKVIVVSTRPGRQGKAIGDWFHEFAGQQDNFAKVELVDLAEVNLPLFDEPNHPMTKEYVHDHTKKWSKTIDAADAYVLILPEYNYFVPPSIVNAIDYLHHEWKYKPAGMVSYGGVSAGTRSAQSLKPLLTSVGVVPLSEGVFLPFSKGFIDEASGTFRADDSHREAALRMLSELEKWATALKPLHTTS
jgi:NAD(P)H-dependent FMN reductase